MNVLLISDLLEQIINYGSADTCMNVLHVNHALYAMRNCIVCNSLLKMRHANTKLCARRLSHNGYTCFVHFESYDMILPEYAKSAIIKGIASHDQYMISRLQCLTLECKWSLIIDILNHVTFTNLRVLKIDARYHFQQDALRIPETVRTCEISGDWVFILPPHIQSLKIWDANVIDNRNDVFSDLEIYEGPQWYNEDELISFVETFPNLKHCTLIEPHDKMALPSTTHTLILLNDELTPSIDFSNFDHLKTFKVYDHVNIVQALPSHLHTLVLDGVKLNSNLVFSNTIQHLTLYLKQWPFRYEIPRVQTLRFLFSSDLTSDQLNNIPLLNHYSEFQSALQCAFALRNFDCKIRIHVHDKYVQLKVEHCNDLDQLFRYCPENCNALRIYMLNVRDDVEFKYQDQTMYTWHTNNVSGKKIYTQIHNVPIQLKLFIVGKRRII